MNTEKSKTANKNEKHKLRPFLIAGTVVLIIIIMLWRCDSAIDKKASPGKTDTGQSSGAGHGQGSGDNSGQGAGQNQGNGSEQSAGNNENGHEQKTSNPDTHRQSQNLKTTEKNASQTPDVSRDNAHGTQNPEKNKTNELYKNWTPSNTEAEIWSNAIDHIGRLSPKDPPDFIFPRLGMPGTSVRKSGEKKFKVEGFFDLSANTSPPAKYYFTLSIDTESGIKSNLVIKKK